MDTERIVLDAEIATVRHSAAARPHQPTPEPFSLSLTSDPRSRQPDLPVSCLWSINHVTSDSTAAAVATEAGKGPLAHLPSAFAVRGCPEKAQLTSGAEPEQRCPMLAVMAAGRLTLRIESAVGDRDLCLLNTIPRP